MKLVRGRRYQCEGLSGFAVDPRTVRASGLASEDHTVLRGDDGGLFTVPKMGIELALPVPEEGLPDELSEIL